MNCLIILKNRIIGVGRNLDKKIPPRGGIFKTLTN